MKKIAIITSKGGTGKSTTAINLGYGLAMRGQRVLVIDCDSQGNVAMAFNVCGQRTLCDLLLQGKVDIMKVRENLFVIDSGGKRLAETELLMANKPGREVRLKNVLSRLRGCDYVICDCSPSTNLVNINALTFADQVIIPVSMDFFAMAGARDTLDTIQEIEATLYHSIELLGVLGTFFDKRTKASHEVLDALHRHFGDKLFQTVIRTNTQLREAPSFHQTIFEYAPYSHGAEDYYLLTEEVFNHGR